MGADPPHPPVCRAATLKRKELPSNPKSNARLAKLEADFLAAA